MSEKPIIMSGGSVRAILASRKTQSRRVVKPEPVDDAIIMSEDCSEWWDVLDGDPRSDGSIGPYRCPYGKVGDSLWVRETWAHNMGTGGGIIYRADHRDAASIHKIAWGESTWATRVDRWRSPIHMPKRYARLWLRVLDVRVERLHDITEADASAEGVTSIPDGPETVYLAHEPSRKRQTHYEDARSAFAAAWNTRNAQRGYPWSVNPWVWVVTFRVSASA